MSSLDQDPDAPRPERNPNAALAVLVLCQLMVGLDATLVNIALPKIGAGLHLSLTGLSWVVTAYVLPFGGLLLLGGRAGDVLGRRRTFMAGVAVFTLASVLAGCAPSGWVLLLARALQGLGAAFAAPATLSLVASNFDEGKPRDRALAAVTGAYGVSSVLGLVLGGALTAGAGWRAVMFVNVPLGAAILVLAPRFVQESERRRDRFDLLGGVLGTLGAAALVYGLTNAAGDGWAKAPTVAALVAGPLALAAFVAAERRASHPVMPLGLFRDRRRSTALGMILLLAAAMFAVNFLITQLLQYGFGFGPMKSALAFLPMAAGLMTAAGSATRLLQKAAAGPVVAAGSLLLGGGMLWLARLSPDSGYTGSTLGPLILVGLGTGLCFTAANQLVISGVADQHSGSAAGVLETTQWIGGSLGLGVFTAVYGGAAGADSAGGGIRGLAHPMSVAFTCGVVVCAATLVLAMLLPRGSGQVQEVPGT